MITSVYNLFTGKLTKVLLKHRLDTRGVFGLTCCKTFFLKTFIQEQNKLVVRNIFCIYFPLLFDCLFNSLVSSADNLCKTVWSQIRPDIMWSLIWIKTS